MMLLILSSLVVASPLYGEKRSLSVTPAEPKVGQPVVIALNPETALKAAGQAVPGKFLWTIVPKQAAIPVTQPWAVIKGVAKTSVIVNLKVEDAGKTEEINSVTIKFGAAGDAAVVTHEGEIVLTAAEQEHVRPFRDSIKFLAEIENLKKQLLSGAEDEDEAQKALDEIASIIRKHVHKPGASDSVSQLRATLRAEITKLLFQHPAFQHQPKLRSQVLLIIARMKSNLISDESSASIKKTREFYDKLAEALSPSKPVPPGATVADLDSLDVVFAKLQPEIQKFGKSNRETYEKHMKKFLNSIKAIVETQYSDVVTMKKDTKTAVDAMTRDVHVIPGSKASGLWEDAYTKHFVPWADASSQLNANTVTGWRIAITLMSEVLIKSIGARAEWITRAKRNLLDKRPSSALTGTTTGGGQYATWGGVIHARQIARMRARFKRRGLRVQAISGGY